MFTPKVWSSARKKFRDTDILDVIARKYESVITFIVDPNVLASILRHLLRATVNGNDEIMVRGTTLFMHYGEEVAIRVGECVGQSKEERTAHRKRLFLSVRCAIEMISLFFRDCEIHAHLFLLRQKAPVWKKINVWRMSSSQLLQWKMC